MRDHQNGIKWDFMCSVQDQKRLFLIYFKYRKSSLGGPLSVSITFCQRTCNSRLHFSLLQQCVNLFDFDIGAQAR